MTNQQPAERFLPLAGVRNARDAGGYQTSSGATVRRLALLRTATLVDLTDSDRQFLGEIGLRTVVDMRSAGEIQTAPDALDGLDVDTCHAPPLVDLLADIPGPLVDLYPYMIDNGGAAFAEAVKALARPGALPALVHCTAGKDRTGLLIAMVLELLGVDDETIVEDYLLSNGGLGIDAGNPLLYSRIEASLLADAVALVRSKFGGTAGYLRAHGVTDAEIEALRSALLA